MIVYKELKSFRGAVGGQWVCLGFRCAKAKQLIWEWTMHGPMLRTHVRPIAAKISGFFHLGSSLVQHGLRPSTRSSASLRVLLQGANEANALPPTVIRVLIRVH